MKLHSKITCYLFAVTRLTLKNLPTFTVPPELSSGKTAITHSVCVIVMHVCMWYVVTGQFCKIDHCIHINVYI